MEFWIFSSLLIRFKASLKCTVALMRNQSKCSNLLSWFNLLFMEINISCFHCITDGSLRVSYFQGQTALLCFHPIVDLANRKADCLVSNIVFLSSVNQCWKMFKQLLANRLRSTIFGEFKTSSFQCRQSSSWLSKKRYMIYDLYFEYGIWKILDNVAKRYSNSS